MQINVIPNRWLYILSICLNFAYRWYYYVVIHVVFWVAYDKYTDEYFNSFKLYFYNFFPHYMAIFWQQYCALIFCRICLDDNHNSVVLACAKVVQCVLSYDANENYCNISEVTGFLLSFNLTILLRLKLDSSGFLF